MIEKIVTILLLIVTVLLLNPFDFWMPDMMVIGMLIFILVLFGIFASFVLRESRQDERDEAHRSLAGRNAFLAGSGVLILAIVFQGYSHNVDPWVVFALSVMVTVKIITRLWSDKNL